MQKGSHLQFCCTSCQHSIQFNVLELEKHKYISCEKCQKKYLFSDEDLIRQIKKFSALCYQIKDSEEILGNTSIGIDISHREESSRSIKIPFKLLLTRFTTHLDLIMDEKPIAITFRIEPVKDVEKVC